MHSLCPTDRANNFILLILKKKRIEKKRKEVEKVGTPVQLGVQGPIEAT